tara:strand:- start:403 stop:1008 length:606 start_codon:yes stop_codon:yes gene_type:complete
MKNALLVGCGNTRGEKIVSGCQDAGYIVTNIGQTQSKNDKVNNIKVAWKELSITNLHKILHKIDTKLDFIFFNQNSSSLADKNFTQTIDTLDLWSLTKNWTQSYWLSCQMPYVLIKTLENKLDDDCKIGWMLSSYIDKDKSGVLDHPDYSGYKFTNYLIMKNYSKKYNTFGINPEFESSDKIQKLITNICNGNNKCNGEIF